VSSITTRPHLQTGTTDPSSESLWALVLAGGDGARLRSLTQLIAGAPIPKQYCRILGPRSLLETTLWRISAERTLAIINRTIGRMCRVVAGLPQKIALLGVRPERAESGYGYIMPGRALGAGGDTFAVRAFHEKPVAGVAAEMVRRGALWNSLVLVSRVRRVLDLLRALRPADVALLEDAPLDLAALATVYERLQAWNFSHEFLTRIPEHLVVTRADGLGWSDWGTPEAIERSFAAMGVVPPWRGRVEAA